MLDQERAHAGPKGFTGASNGASLFGENEDLAMITKEKELRYRWDEGLGYPTW